MSKFNFNFYLDIREKLKSGLHSIKVNLYDKENKEAITFTIKKVKGLEISASKDDWLDIWENKNKKDSFGDVTGERTVYGRKHEIRTILKAKQNILNEIIKREDIFNVNDVKKEFNSYTPPNVFVNDVYFLFDSYVKKLITENRYKTASSYKTTLNNLKNYNNNLPFRFNDISIDWLKSYDRNRRTNKNGNVSAGTLGIEMRNIRSVYNLAKKLNKSLQVNYPFGKDKYIIPESDGNNKGLEDEALKKLKDFKSDNWYLQMARDFWMFSYYARGMNLKDMAKLKIGQKEFIRSKTEFTTKKVIKIPFRINDKQKEIVKKYKGTGKYLLDIIDDRDSLEAQQKKINNKLSSVAKQLKNLVKILELPKEFSFIWARHTYATNVLKAGVNPKAISESLGHTSFKTSENYFNQLLKDSQDEIDDALEID